ncbi:ABC transporter permease [Catenulispora subtropica]|uniref:ABC transporter permease n=2 Tax=Catenulispora subtropica TaxID=450798 RepID=A0ABP5DXT0_9ACTN
MAGGCWEAAARLGLVDSTYLPPPSAVFRALPGLLIHGPLAGDLLASLIAITYGVVLAHLVSLPLAAATFRFKWLREFISPLVELVRGIAPLALLPAFLLLFGIGRASAVAIIVWCAWVPIFLNLLEGLDAVDPTLVRSARATGAGRLKVATSVLVPASMGHYLTGLRLAIGSAWLAVVAAEMLGSNSGLGFRILEWSQVFRITDMYAAIVVIGAAGLIMNSIVAATQRRLLRWRSA